MTKIRLALILAILFVNTIYCEKGDTDSKNQNDTVIKTETTALPGTDSKAKNGTVANAAKNSTVANAETTVSLGIVVDDKNETGLDVSTVPAPITTTNSTPITTPPTTTPTPSNITTTPITPPNITTTTPPTPPPTNATTKTPITKPTIPPTPITNATTSKPTSTPTPTPHKDRHFDGASFIGGIILAVGLMGIGFIAFKFYKARTERNYHTL